MVRYILWAPLIGTLLIIDDVRDDSEALERGRQFLKDNEHFIQCQPTILRELAPNFSRQNPQHPTKEEIRAALGGKNLQLSRDSVLRIMTHIQGCEDCQRMAYVLDPKLNHE